jgi:cell division septation protein DedD
MTRSTTTHSTDDGEFVLKHRIVGAAFLLFFGALFLPWVLGAPDSGKSMEEAIDLAKQEVASPVSEQADRLADELSAAVASEEVAIEEQVYISKITPVGLPETSAAEAAQETASKSGEQSTTAETPTSDDQALSGAVEPAAADTQAAENEVLEQTLAKAETPQTIEVGWIVQVGVFTDKKGAGRVVDDLRNKGFSPSTTIVDTNRGKATGTRIWLGPYAQRVDAAKAKSELTQKTGEAGFIRAYP